MTDFDLGVDVWFTHRRNFQDVLTIPFRLCSACVLGTDVNLSLQHTSDGTAKDYIALKMSGPMTLFFKGQLRQPVDDPQPNWDHPTVKMTLGVAEARDSPISVALPLTKSGERVWMLRTDAP